MNRSNIAMLLSGLILGLLVFGSQVRGEEKLLVYVGTYTSGASEGIYRCRFDPQTGELTSDGVAARTENPSFLAIHPNRRFLYAVNEGGKYEGAKSGAVSSFAIDAHSGELNFLNQTTSMGGGPCHLVVGALGKSVLVANYGGGSVACLPIRDDGSLGQATSAIQHQGKSINPDRQEGPHAHSINLDSAGRFAVAADLGLDKVLVYRFDRKAGTLVPNDPPSASVTPGAGPRHFAFHPSGRFAYVINEIHSTVTAFGYDAKRGVLETIETVSTLPADFDESSSTADVQVHPSGRFLYGSNRGHDSIVTFAIDGETGTLTLVGHQSTLGKTPRNFAIDPAGRFLLAENQDTDDIVVFRIDPDTGRLVETSKSVSVPSPVCVKMMPVGE